MKPKWPTLFLKVFEKLVPRLSKMYAFLVPSRQRTFLNATEHPWTKTILSRGDRRKLFNPDLTRSSFELITALLQKLRGWIRKE